MRTPTSQIHQQFKPRRVIIYIYILRIGTVIHCMRPVYICVMRTVHNNIYHIPSR